MKSEVGMRNAECGMRKNAQSRGLGGREAEMTGIEEVGTGMQVKSSIRVL